MAILSLKNFGVLLILHVALGVPWSARPAARYEGYDLERGPVLYEAYYPEEQDVAREPKNIYQEKRYFDRINVPERSFQIPNSDPYEMPYEPEETEMIHEEYVQPNSGYLSAFTATRPLTVQKRGSYTGNNERKKEYIFAEQPLNEQTSQDRFRSMNIANDYSFARSQSNDYGNENEGESDFIDENQMDFGAQDVQRIVPINDEFVFGEPPMRKMLPEFRESFENLNEKKVFQKHNFGDHLYNQRKEIRETLPMEENIFEPRPQTINYVFSAPAMKKVEKLKPAVNFESESEDNDWPRNYGDNIIQGEIKKADEQELKNQEAKISSIEVSQVSHQHKIRHHHGELPKRKYIHK